MTSRVSTGLDFTVLIGSRPLCVLRTVHPVTVSDDTAMAGWLESQALSALAGVRARPANSQAAATARTLPLCA